MRSWGPYTLAVNTPQKIVVGSETPYVQIHNESPYLLLVAIQDAQPTALDTLTGQYQTVITPWAHPVVRTQVAAASQRERALNAISDFRGTIWLMPVAAPQTKINTGTWTNYTYVVVDSFTSQDIPPQAWSVPRESVETSQQRVVALPLAVPYGSGVWNPGGAGISTPILDVALSATNIAQGIVNGYLHAFLGQVTSPGGANAYLEYSITAELDDATHTILAGIPAQTLFHAVGSYTVVTSVGVAFGAPPVLWPGVPAVGRFGFSGFAAHNPAAAFLRLQLFSNVISGSPRLQWNVLGDVDLLNIHTPGGVGEFTNDGIF